VDLASLKNDPVALRSQRAAQREALIQLAHLAEVTQSQCIAGGWPRPAPSLTRKRSSVVLPLPFGPTRPDLHARSEDEIQPGKEAGAGVGSCPAAR